MAGNPQSMYLESRVLSADPVELVQMLTESAMESVAHARQYLKQGDITARAKAINHAIAILAELTASLNHDAGGDFSRTLHSLYDYMQRRLIEANFQQSDSPLAEVSKLMTTLAEGWTSCKSPSRSVASEAPQAGPTPSVQAAPIPEPWEYRAPEVPEPTAYTPYGSFAYGSSADGADGSGSCQPRFALSY